MGQPFPSNMSLPSREVDGKTSSRKGLCNPGFDVTLINNRKRALGYVFKGSWVL